MHVRFSPRAKADLRSIHSYIAERNPEAAVRAIDRILGAVATLETFPLLGRPGRHGPTRELVIRGLPYFVVYALPDEYHIDIERVLHGARAWPPEDDA